MHGRLKVRTSEEEKARKEKERQEKLKQFKYAMQKILTKRKNDEQDKEQLDLTEKVLCSNPDIHTLWNIRREVLISIGKMADNEETISKLYDSELHLTEYCLKINPKSYCSWLQREWVLTTRTDPDWKKELELCNTYLKLDERNFHTWDYRHFVVSKCKPPLQEEFEFTTEKLYDNFSNYSAWHYRSKILLELYPDLVGGRPIQDNHHKHELKMVQSAAFTDPDDTSAWFYQRWLLGAVKETVRVVTFTVTPQKTTAAWNKFVSAEYISSQLKVYFNDTITEGKWISCNEHEYDNLWIFDHDQEISDDIINVKVEHKTLDDENEIITCEKYEPYVFIGKNNICFQNQYSEAVMKELNEQLDSCRQLLALEPDSKWTLLTTTVFLHCINASLYHKEVVENLETLKKVDSLRAGYYNDLLSKWNIEQQLPCDYKNNSMHYKNGFNEKLTSLPHLQYYNFCKSVDFSNQDLTSCALPCLKKLQHCKELDLSGNKLTTLKKFPYLNLEVLNLENNPDLNLEEIELFKEKHKSIKIIY